MQFLRADTSEVIMLGPAVDATDGVTLEAGLAAAMDTATTGIRISKNGGAWEDRNGTPTTTVYDEGWYRVTLNTTDTNTEGTLDVMFEQAATCLPLMARFQVVNANVYDSLFDAATTDYLQVDTIQVGGTTQTARNLGASVLLDAVAVDAIWDEATSGHVTPGTYGVAVTDILTDTAEIGAAGAGLTNIGTIATCTNVTNGVTLANGAITDASLAGNMETVFETNFNTNYNPTRAAWVTNVQDTVGTGNLPADVIAVSTSTTAANNLETLFDGNEGFYSAYSGPRGPGVYLNDAAANTNTTNGVDGTIGNPVSTIAAARTLADSMSLDRIYIVNDSAITLAATMEDYEFVGLGEPSSNSVALNSQDVDQSSFFNLTITGIQGGSLQARYEDCIFGTATIYPYALRCGFSDGATGVTFSNNADVILDSCFSMVAGNATPILICSGANLDVSLRHYSGGIQINSGSATATMSIETDGQVIIDASTNSSFALTVRGNATITDNASLSSLTQDAVYNAANVNAEVDTALDTAIPGSPTANSINERIRTLDDDWADAGRLDTILDARASQTTADAIETDTTNIQSRLPAALVNNRMDSDTTAISGDSTAADRLEGLMDGILLVQVNDAGATTTAFAADGFTETTDDHFNGRLITFVSGNLTGQQTDITDYDAVGGVQGSQQFTVTALTEAPANNDWFVIH